MKKLFILIIIIQNFFLYSLNIISNDSRKKLNNNKTIPGSKIIRYETAMRLDTFNFYKTEDYLDFMMKSQSFSFLYYDQAFFNNLEWHFFTFSEFPYFSIWISNKSLWYGKIELKAKVDAYILFLGNFDDLDENIETDENFYGHFIIPELNFCINPINKLFFTVTYSGFIEIYHEDNIEGEKNFKIKPTQYSNLISLEAKYDTLDINKGIYSRINTGFLIRTQDYYWGYDNKEKINQFSFSIENVIFFRIPLKTVNNSYFEINIEEYYLYNNSINYGTQKLSLDENRYTNLTLINGYNERELNFSKALKFRGLFNLNFFSKEVKADKDKKKLKNYFSNFINMYAYFIYNIMYFNDNIDNIYFFYNNNVINGFGTGYKISINPIFKRASHEFIISSDFSYGFDIYNYENRFDRFLITIGFLWSMLI